MARPLRLEVVDAWHHVMHRGQPGGALFLDEADRRRFLGAVAELPERFELEVRAFVRMPNHYHLSVRTREANLSPAIRWLNVSYAIKLDGSHRCHGTVFPGRFKGVLLQEGGKAVEVQSVGLKYQAGRRWRSISHRRCADDPERQRFVAQFRSEMSTI